MKEFNAQTGGRYTYVDDIVNLQDLALAFASIFDDCDNFIISGCKISGSTISSGYVYINGKIRHFSGVSGIAAWPQYLYETNKTETVAYASGDDKVGRNIYGCAISSEVPTSLDALTGETPMFIQLTEAGGMRLRDAFFGKYALLLHSASETQTVSDVVTFDKDINVNGVLTANGAISLIKGNAKGKVFYSDNKLVIQSQVTGKTMNIVVDANEGFKLSINNDTLLTVNPNRTTIAPPIATKTSTIGNIYIAQNDIVNKGVASDDACININVKGYNNDITYYRNTIIGDGKGSAVLKVTGSTKNVHIKGDLSIDSTATASLSLKKNKLIQWLNETDTQIAYVGYNEGNVFGVKNTVASIVISAKEFVDITPAIKENGTLLSEKYATRAYLVAELGKKANTNNVYDKALCDTKFLIKNQGLVPLLTVFTKDQLCGQIGAATKTYADTTFVTKDKLLSDIATSAATKIQICENIGAAYGEYYQKKLKDTGWTEVQSGLFARQIGDIVQISGSVPIQSTVFTLPDSIGAPKYDAIYNMASSKSVNHQGQGEYTTVYQYCTLKIAANTRTCKLVKHLEMIGETISVSMTYMV